MLKEKTEAMANEAKDMMNHWVGQMFIAGDADIFDVENADDPTVKMMVQCIKLSNQYFDLEVAKAEQLDDINDKLDIIIKNQCK